MTVTVFNLKLELFLTDIFCYNQIGDYLLTLPQQLEPFITQENPALEAAMKAGNLPFPDQQGMPITAKKRIAEKVSDL